MTDKPPTFKGFIERSNKSDHEVVADKMRAAGLPVEHTMFATIHHKSDDRPDGYTEAEKDSIAKGMIKKDVENWNNQLSDHKRDLSPVETGAYSDNGNEEGVPDYDDEGFPEAGHED